MYLKEIYTIHSKFEPFFEVNLNLHLIMTIFIYFRRILVLFVEYVNKKIFPKMF